MPKRYSKQNSITDFGRPLLRLLPVACMVGLISLAVLTIMPIVSKKASATCATGNVTSDCVVGLAENEQEVNVATSISVMVDNKLSMNIIPQPGSATAMSSTTVHVATNSLDGYALFLQASDGLDNTSNINNDSSVNKISITNKTATLDDLDKDTYGYYLGKDTANSNTAFAPLPTASTMVEQTNSTTISDTNTDYGYGDSYNLAFGVKVSTELPAGTYSGKVTISAVANPLTVKSLAGLTYMQDISTSICANTKESYTKQLIDTRDGKSYWVAKLKDGNCWMTQNLALNLGTAPSNEVEATYGKYVAKLTPADSDVNGEWVAPETRSTQVTLPNSASNPPENDILSWNMGKIVLKNPTKSNSCPTVADGKDGDNAIGNESIADNCPNFYQDVSNGWKEGYTATSTSSLDTSTKTYDSHYLIGNFYQFNAATAGTGNSGLTANNAEAAASICPKGWRLPSGGNQERYTFKQLLIQANHYTFDDADSVAITPDPIGAVKRLDYEPTFFTHSGYVSPVNGSFRAAGLNGYYWSKTSSGVSTSSLFSYALHVGGTVYSSLSSHRYDGYNVRCLAK